MSTTLVHLKTTTANNHSLILNGVNVLQNLLRPIIIPTKKLQWKFANNSQCNFYGLVYGAYLRCRQYFSYIVAVTFISGGNRSTR